MLRADPQDLRERKVGAWVGGWPWVSNIFHTFLAGRTRLHVSPPPHPLDDMPSFCFEEWGTQPSHQHVDLREALPRPPA